MSSDGPGQRVAIQRRSRRRFLVVSAATLLALIELVTVLRMHWFEEQFWFRPAPAEYGDWNPAELNFEEARFTSADGTPLFGWFVPHETPRAVVLYCPGSGGNLSYYADTLRKLHDEMRVSVLIFDYRGFGKSGGAWHGQQGLLDDARAARRWLAERAACEEREITLLGRSLGTGVAIDLAVKDGARALVLEGAFTSLPEIFAGFYRWAPLRLPMRNQLRSIDLIADFRGPLLQCHGGADRVVKPALAQRLFDAAHEPKRLVLMPGVAHDDPPAAEYYRALNEFLDELTNPR